MEKQKMNKISMNLSTNQENFMDSLRRNLDMYIAEPDYTLRELSEASNVSMSTLSSILYTDAKDCKLSTVVALAKALDISIEELVGAGTIEPIAKESIRIVRNLSPASKYFVRHYIRHLYHVDNAMSLKCEKHINVMNPIVKGMGELFYGNDIFQLNIDNFSNEIKAKVFFGIRIPCEHYLPLYAPNTVLLLANDRKPTKYEYCIISYYSRLYVAIYYIENSKGFYRGIINKSLNVRENDIDELLGYVVESIVLTN